MRRNVRRLNREVGHISGEIGSAVAPAVGQAASSVPVVPPTDMMPIQGAPTYAENQRQDISFSSPQLEQKNGSTTKRPLKSRKAANLAGALHIICFCPAVPHPKRCVLCAQNCSAIFMLLQRLPRRF